MLAFLCFLIAFICFLLAALRVEPVRINLVAVGLAFAIIPFVMDHWPA